MRIIKSLIIAFSMYSKIPMPQFEWKEKDMQYVLCFFPWVGAAAGFILIGWWRLCWQLSVGSLCMTLIGAAIPILVTGGFHVDGFMDTMDALHSYQSRERKLEILKDSHIGAFSVIMLLLYYLIYLAAFSEVKDLRICLIVCIGFILSRILSGMAILIFRPAKKDGLLRLFGDRAAGKIVFAALLLQLLLCVTGLLYLSVPTGLFVLTAAGMSFMYYRYRSYKEFGGITGDTAGWFILICEAAIVIAAAVGSHF